jgi:uncharacterized RDD family membrane protein YckC
MSNYDGGGSYGYPQHDAGGGRPGGGGGGYGYPEDSGGYGYPGAPQTEGSLQPQNLGWEPSRRGTIGREAGGYYQCAFWGWRVLAGLIDYGPLFLLYYVATEIDRKIRQSFYYGNAWAYDWGPVVETLAFVVCALLLVGNSIVLQGLTAQSIGKKVLGMQLVRGVVSDQQGQSLVRPGVVWTLIRMISHVVDSICYIGFFAPLFTARRQTFADMIVNTVVLKEPRPIDLTFAPLGARRAELR